MKRWHKWVRGCLACLGDANVRKANNYTPKQYNNANYAGALLYN